MHKFVRRFFSFLIYLAYHSYGVSGLNSLFLFMPAKLLIPTLNKYGANISSDADMQIPITFHNISEIKGSHYSNLVIGKNCYVGKEVFFDLADKIILEEGVTISMRVTLVTHTHAGKSSLTNDKLPPSYAPIRLCNNCYIGASAIILPGITIGERAIVGAGAVVTKNVPEGATVVGSPAKILRIGEEHAYK